MDGMYIRPIDLNEHFDVCIRFRTDSYYCSFGNLDGIALEMGLDGRAYRERMIEKCLRLPNGNVHLFVDDEIVGQLEMRFLPDEGVAYVNLFYVAPHSRRKGLGRVLHARAVEVAQSCNASKLRLSVSQTNRRAIAFYQALEWVKVGFRPDKPDVWLMERSLKLASA